MIKRVNAEIKSKSELYKRLFEGEIFYTPTGGKLHYDEVYILTGETPFRFDEEYLASVACRYRSLLSEVDVEWFDNITEPVLCWASDNCIDDKDYPVLIFSYDKGEYAPFKSRIISWRYATPVTPEDLLQ